MKTRYDASRHHRRSIRLPEYDYTQTGGYFVTLCTYQHEPLFGEVVDEQMVLNGMGYIARGCWQDIPLHFPHVELDAFVVMPNHLHGILLITDAVGATQASPVPPASPLRPASPVPPASPVQPASPLQPDISPPQPSPPPGIPSHPGGPKQGSIGAVVGSFKSAVSKHINRLRDTPGQTIWQRNYWEHVIRSDRALDAIRQYIADNPARWAFDRYHPAPVGRDPRAAELWRLLQEDAPAVGATHASPLPDTPSSPNQQSDEEK